MSELKYLELLSKSFPSIAETSTEIVNLQAILNLPKGTEHFLTDVHGEYEAFSHVLRNGSGSIRQKIEDIFQDTLTESEKKNWRQSFIIRTENTIWLWKNNRI